MAKGRTTIVLPDIGLTVDVEDLQKFLSVQGYAVSVDELRRRTATKQAERVSKAQQDEHLFRLTRRFVTAMCRNYVPASLEDNLTNAEDIQRMYTHARMLAELVLHGGPRG